MDDNTIRVIRGDPTADELAAIVSVFEAMAAEHEGKRARRAEHASSAWLLSQRPIRIPILPGISRWSSFS